MKAVVAQKWEESERGWGVRPDGYSIHRDTAALNKFIQHYWTKMPADPPDEYSRPSGKPYIADVSDDVYELLMNQEDGTLVYSDNNYPGTGGTDGWINGLR